MKKLNIHIFLSALCLITNCERDLDILDDSEFTVYQFSNWEIAKSTYEFEINPRDLFFVNNQVGFVIGYNGYIYKTYDSGQSWEKMNSGTTLHLLSVFFINQNIGYIAGQAMSACIDDDCGKGSILLKTTNGGETWTKKFFPEFTKFYSLSFFDELNGLAIIHTLDVSNSRDYYIAKTSDGGNSWEFIDLDIKPTYNKFIAINGIIYIAGENQKIFKSTDSGDSWVKINTPIEAYNDVRNIYFYNENIGYIDGIKQIYKTIDGGLNWVKKDFPFSTFGVFHFYNENEGFNIEKVWAYEGNEFPTFKGSIIHQTMDGGDSWKKSNLIDTLSLGLTHFPHRDLGYGINFSEFYVLKRKK